MYKPITNVPLFFSSNHNIVGLENNFTYKGLLKASEKGLFKYKKLNDQQNVEILYLLLYFLKIKI